MDGASKPQGAYELLSTLISLDRRFKPYCPNDPDDYYWTLDGGNDWKLKFSPDQPTTFEVIYRYNTGNDYEAAFALWLGVVLSAAPAPDGWTEVQQKALLATVNSFNQYRLSKVKLPKSEPKP